MPKIAHDGHTQGKQPLAQHRILMQYFNEDRQKQNVSYKRQPIKRAKSKIFSKYISFSSEHELLIENVGIRYADYLTHGQYDFIVDMNPGRRIIEDNKNTIPKNSIPYTYKKVL
jgi:hypothetical protein